MPMGSGKYNNECTLVREKTDAKGVLLIVLDGKKGSGFSCQADALITLKLPAMLEDIARQIRESLKQGKI